MTDRKKTWGIILLSSLVILAPILYGLSVYQQLPANMVVHFNIHNQPDQWAPKPFVTFGIPVLMLLLQWVCVLVMRWRVQQNAAAPRFERVVYTIVPLINLVVYLVSIQFNLGHDVDVRRIVLLLISVIFIAMGNYLPTIPFESQRYLNRPRLKHRDLWQRFNRVLGYSFIGGGLILLVSLFFPAIWSAVGLFGFIAWLFWLLWHYWRLDRRN